MPSVPDACFNSHLHQLCRAYEAFEATKTEAVARAVNDDNCKDSQVRLEGNFKATFGCEEIGWGKAKSNGGRCSRFSVDLAAVVRAELRYGYVFPINLHSLNQQVLCFIRSLIGVGYVILSFTFPIVCGAMRYPEFEIPCSEQFSSAKWLSSPVYLEVEDYCTVFSVTPLCTFEFRMILQFARLHVLGSFSTLCSAELCFAA